MSPKQALQLAIGHIEHMGAWIGRTNAAEPGHLVGSYSFEGLGEDLPDIKAALASLDTAKELTERIAEEAA